MDKYTSKILKQKDLYVETRICRGHDSSFSTKEKLYQATITHVPSRIKSCYISELNPMDAYNIALQQLEERVGKLFFKNVCENMTHLSEEGQEEYNKIVDGLYRDTGINLFD